MDEHPTTHPDFGELEAYRRDEADEATAAHIVGCTECQLRMQELESLAALVRETAAPLPAVPDDFEKRLLWNARQNAARVRRQARTGYAPSSMRRWAIAAGLLLSIATAALWRQTHRGSTPSAKLDIVDALALARSIAAARPADARYDVNHDGQVDSADVDAIVRQAVAL